MVAIAATIGKFGTMNSIKVNTPELHESWLSVLKPEFESAYFTQLKSFILNQKKEHTVYPPGPDIFNALNYTPLNEVKVVIIGQDPYHGPDQAHGLCFSVKKGIKLPPSLRNIYKELEQDLGIKMGLDGDLTAWAKQGVLLLNATLTVNQGMAGSHQKQGWERFTDTIIDAVNQHQQNVVYLLWGRFAQQKASRVNEENNLLLKSVHPSPLSAHNGFFGCKHFSQTNAYLESHGKSTIDWAIE